MMDHDLLRSVYSEDPDGFTAGEAIVVSVVCAVFALVIVGLGAWFVWANVGG